MKQDETFVRGGNNPYARSNGGQRTILMHVPMVVNVQAVRLIFLV